ncbi:MAG: hypothetical protein D6805_04085 [Planctomycetota bacterium]|nr:MAG: hypothetical protein D6805_04085 [Planctomycetota bacterium]
MGIAYFLGCRDCEVFLDLDKFPFVELQKRNLEEFSFSSAWRLFRVLPVGVVEVEEELKWARLGGYSGWVREKISYIERFLSYHQGHTLFIALDRYDLPWDLGEEGFYRWKEVCSSSSSLVEFFGYFLPRNLLEDFGFEVWESVEEFMERQSYAIRSTFEYFREEIWRGYRKWKEGFDSL